MRQLWINGAGVAGSEAPHRAIDPATEQPIGEVAWGTAADAGRAVAAARAAWPAWRRLPAPERAAMLHEVAGRLRQRLEQIATELTLETGRSVRKNRGYVEWSAQCFEYYAELGRHIGGRVIPSMENSQLAMVLKVPLGVVAAIIPWNYPLLLLSWKVAPALAAGNTVVIKPAEYTSWVSLGFAALFDHLPPGVVNIVSGDGPDAGEALVRHPDVRLIAFTGSIEVGQHIMRLAADDVKRLNLELGGKDPLIVCDDAAVDVAARAAVWGAFLNAGQVCTSVERVYVDRALYQPFVDRVVDLTNQLVVGPGIDPESEVTPMIRPVQREKVMRQVDDALAHGATMLTGGRIPPGRPKGYYYEPTVLIDVGDKRRVMQEETFGPVMPIRPVASFDEALRLANALPFGLGATLFTKDARKVKRYMEEIEVGNVWVNEPLTDNVAGPFGGMKRSGLGRELGEEGFFAFTETKHVHWEMEANVKPWWYPWE